MNKTGPIIVIEDDEDDQQILKEVFNSLNYENEVILFEDGQTAYDYLLQTHVEPFLIISDINLPKMTGIELRDKVKNNEDLRLQCVPFLFITTGASRHGIIEAYSKSIQGFFVKPSSIVELENTIRKIVEYWKVCIYNDC